MSARRVVIVGAGPAGLSAAIASAKAGLEVLVIDERSKPGGRLRYDGGGSVSLGALLSDCAALGVRIRSNAVAWGVFPGWQIATETPNGPEIVESETLILATGSTDRALAFEGNTLPGVMGGIGLRRLIREYGVLPGQRMLVLGDGPDAAATASAVRELGGEIVRLVAEDEARSAVVRGTGGVERVSLAGHDYPVDIVAVAVGRQPELLLATMAEAELAWRPKPGDWVPLRDWAGMSTRPGLFVAGDAAGVDNVEIAALDGVFAAQGAAALLGAVDATAVADAAARVEALRPDRFSQVVGASMYEQPWHDAFEVQS